MGIREINQRRLRYFYEVLSRGSIRGAADALNTASSVLTRQLRLLEDEVGAPLFERGNRGVSPTEAAHALLAYWRGCQSEREALESTLQDLKGLQMGSVRIATSEGFVESLMDDVLTPFINDYPKLDVTVSVMPVNDVVSEVANDVAHIGLAYNPPPAPRVVHRASGWNPARLVASREHPLAARTVPLQLAEVEAWPLALMTSAFGLGQIVRIVADMEHVRLTPTLTSNSVTALKRFVRTGRGLTFLGRSTTLLAPLDQDLTAIDLAHPLFNSTYARVLLREERHLSKAAAALLELIVERMPIFSATPHGER